MEDGRGRGGGKEEEERNSRRGNFPVLEPSTFSRFYLSANISTQIQIHKNFKDIIFKSKKEVKERVVVGREGGGERGEGPGASGRRAWATMR